MLEEVERAGAHQLHRAGELGIAPDHHDRERKIAAIDFGEQRRQPDTGEIDRAQGRSRRPLWPPGRETARALS